MIQVLEFWVPGAPKTKGSLTARMVKCRCTPTCNGYRGSPQLRDSDGSKRWRKLVAYQAGQAMRGVATAFPIAGPVSVELWFSLPVIDVTGSGVGDLDKLYRNVLDALTDAGVYGDDVQVVQLSGWKASGVEEFRSEGVRVKVMVLGESG